MKLNNTLLSVLFDGRKDHQHGNIWRFLLLASNLCQVCQLFQNIERKTIAFHLKCGRNQMMIGNLKKKISCSKKPFPFCLPRRHFQRYTIHWSDGEGLKYSFIAEAWNENFIIDDNKKKKQFDQLHYTQPELGEAISLNGKLVSCSYRYL